MAETQGGDVLVSFRGVQKSYDGETLIVKDLNLTFARANSSPCSAPPGPARPPA